MLDLSNSMLQTQLEEAMMFLENAVSLVGEYLNEKNYHLLQQELSGDEQYYKSLLSNMRRLEVFCADGHEACKIVLNNEIFHKGAAEKTLYRIYHQCIEEFFSPKNDAWYEDSRSAYTGRNSIKFHKNVPASFMHLTNQLESGFQSLREDLEYYETDYRTKMLQSK